MSLFRHSDARRSDPDEPVVGYEDHRRSSPAAVLGVGTLACRRCDAPVALAGATVAPSAPLNCPFCLHRAPVRDFLSLAHPTRPARVTVRLLAGARARSGRIAATRHS